jgi:hypothetical protein
MGDMGTSLYALCMSSFQTWEDGVALPSLALGKPPLTAQPLLGEPQTESNLGGDCLVGCSVLLRAAGTPMAVLSGRMPLWYCSGPWTSWGDVGETFMDVLSAEPVGEYWADFL